MYDSKSYLTEKEHTSAVNKQSEIMCEVTISTTVGSTVTAHIGSTTCTTYTHANQFKAIS